MLPPTTGLEMLILITWSASILNQSSQGSAGKPAPPGRQRDGHQKDCSGRPSFLPSSLSVLLGRGAFSTLLGYSFHDVTFVLSSPSGDFTNMFIHVQMPSLPLHCSYECQVPVLSHPCHRGLPSHTCCGPDAHSFCLWSPLLILSCPL